MEVERDAQGQIVAYCIEGCGQRATHEHPLGMTGAGTEITELVCIDHAGDSFFTITQAD
jgi:hypothetical protein